MFKSSFSQLIALADRFERTLKKIAQSDEDFDFEKWFRDNQLEKPDLDKFDPYEQDYESDLEDEEDELLDNEEMGFTPRRRLEEESLWDEEDLFEDEEDY